MADEVVEFAGIVRWRQRDHVAALGADTARGTQHRCYRPFDEDPITGPGRGIEGLDPGADTRIDRIGFRVRDVGIRGGIAAVDDPAAGVAPGQFITVGTGHRARQIGGTGAADQVPGVGLQFLAESAGEGVEVGGAATRNTVGIGKPCADERRIAIDRHRSTKLVVGRRIACRQLHLFVPCHSGTGKHVSRTTPYPISTVIQPRSNQRGFAGQRH